MPARLYFPGFQPNPELDRLFFALRVGAENAVRVVQLCDRLCHQNGLRGRRIAADLLHITLRGVGAYDGLPNFIVERAREAGAAVSTSPFPLTFDRVMSFNGGRGKRPLVLCPSYDLAGLFELHFMLGEAMKRARVGRHLRSHFTPYMTLLYDGRAVRELRIDPILINVRDFVLVHSIVGQHKHIELARWPCGVSLARKFTRGLALTITIYGIKNCDTMKKARGWLDSHGVAYSFHDYKTEGIAKDKLKTWCDELGWETLLNRAGTTFRKLPDADKEGLNERKATALMLAQPSMIKRPVLDLGGKLLVGFKPEIYAKEVAPSGRGRKG